MTFKKPKNETVFLLNRISKQVSELSEKKSALERWGGIVANWSQIVMLLVVLFGYIYTVLPVVQKEQIAEQLAVLEKEKKTWDKQFNDAKNKIDVKNLELQELQKSKKQLQEDIVKLNLEKSKTNEDLQNIRNEFANINIELKKSKASINAAANDLLEQNKESLLGNVTITENFLPLYNNSGSIYDIFRYDNNKDINKSLKESYPLPLEYTDKILARLYKSYASAKGVDKSAKFKLYSQYKSGIEKHLNNLTCPIPNFEAWESSFIEARSLISSLVPSCIDHEFSKKIKEEKWSTDEVSKLKKTQFWLQQKNAFESYCELNLKFELEDVYRDEWKKLADPCEDRLLRVNNIVLDTFDPSKLKPFTDLSAPNKDFVYHALKVKN